MSEKCVYCCESKFIRKEFHHYIVSECSKCGYIQLSIERMSELFYQCLVENFKTLKNNKNASAIHKECILNSYIKLTDIKEILNDQINLSLLDNDKLNCDICGKLLIKYRYLKVFDCYYCAYNGIMIFSEKSFNDLLKIILNKIDKQFFLLRFKHFIKTLIWKEYE